MVQGHTGWITAVCDFPQSDLIMSGARDRTLRIWDVSSGELRQTIPLLGEPPMWLRISPDERLVAIARPPARGRFPSRVKVRKLISPSNAEKVLNTIPLSGIP